jgi:cytidine deaminase
VRKCDLRHAQGPVQCLGVTSGSPVAVRRNDADLIHGCKGAGQREQPGRVDTVVVGNQDHRVCLHATLSAPTLVGDLDALIVRAREVALRAYAPYSQFRVGAAVLDAQGGIHVGCNVENASYGLSVCAERNAIFGAIAAGAARPFAAMAVSCLDASEGGCSPCGACRQVIVEHLRKDAPVEVEGLGRFTPDDLLPHRFRLERE